MEDIHINPSDPRAVRVILRWPGSDPRPIYLGTLLQRLHVQPVAVLQFLTAMMDYVAARGSILATRIEGWGSIGDLSPAPPHCQQVAAEPPPPPPPACAPLVQPQPPNPRPAPQTAPKPKPKPQRPPKREPKSAPKPPPPKKKRLLGESSSEESSSDSSTDSSSGSTTDSSVFEEPQPRPPAKEPTKPPRKAPKRAAPPPPTPTQVKGQAKGKRGRGCKYKAREQVYVVFRDNGEWGIEQGKQALAAGGPPGVGETWISLPKYPKLFAIPRARFGKPRRRRINSSPR